MNSVNCYLIRTSNFLSIVNWNHCRECYFWDEENSIIVKEDDENIAGAWKLGFKNIMWLICGGFGGGLCN